MDHKHVKLEYHSFKKVLWEDCFAIYGNILLHKSFDDPDYALLDTLFCLAEGYLISQIVKLKDAI